MKAKIKFSVLAIKLILAAVFFGILMCLLNNFVGYKEFKKQMEAMYGTISRQLAYTASSYIEADYIPFWLVNGPDEHWGTANEKLQELTQTGELAFIYTTVISEDYKSRKYIFDTLNEQLDSEEYKVIPFGHVSSLEKKAPEYIENLRLVMEEGKSYSSFVYNKEGDGHVTTAVPVKDSTGRIIAIMSVVKPMSEVKLYRENYLRSSIWSAVILTLVFIIIYTSSLYFGIIKPIVLINHETLHFAENHGELTGQLAKVKNHDEIGTLAKSVEKMSHDMIHYINDLTKATAEKERLGAELDVATQIQAQMLPSVFPPYENHPELELYATMEPAKEVGGDFYDFFMIDDNHFAVVVGDVSGKGVPAALFMVIAKTLIKDAAMHSDSPSDIFNRVNNVLCEGNDTSLFVTCWLGILHIPSRELKYANAGHSKPVIYHNNSFSFLDSKPNLMLAAMPDVSYVTHTLHLDDGDRFFVYTDGVTEATDSENCLYGEERLLKVLEMTKGMSSKEILSFVRDDLEGFVNGAPQFDDITMLEMAVKNKNGQTPEMQSIHLPADDTQLQRVNDFIHSFLPEKCSKDIVNQIDLAVEEIFVNIAHYAYSQKGGEATIGCCVKEDVIHVFFEDSGIPFNPLEKKDPDITLSAEERSIGGLGIFLTKKFMDKIDYVYEDGKNKLSFSKKF